MDLVAERQAVQEKLVKENRAYLDDHPEVTQLLNDYISTALAEQPDDVFDFARQYFKGTSNPGEEPNPEPARVQTEADGEQDDLDDLDDLVESSNSSQLRQYLKKVFDETDVDGNGELSKSELKAKLAADDEVQKLLEAAGGSGQVSVLEQLDVDGDGMVTWTEFEQMLGD